LLLAITEEANRIGLFISALQKSKDNEKMMKIVRTKIEKYHGTK